MTRVAMLDVARQQGLPLEFYADSASCAMQLVQDGSDDTGYRIRFRTRQQARREETVFVIREDGEYRISATRKSPSLIGLSVLRLLDAGKPDAARQWLNWTREEFPAGGGDDPLADIRSRHTGRSRSRRATVEEMRIAAALLMPSKELGDRALPILTAAREKRRPTRNALRIDQAIAMHSRGEGGRRGAPASRNGSQAAEAGFGDGVQFARRGADAVSIASTTC